MMVVVDDPEMERQPEFMDVGVGVSLPRDALIELRPDATLDMVPVMCRSSKHGAREISSFLLLLLLLCEEWLNNCEKRKIRGSMTCASARVRLYQASSR